MKLILVVFGVLGGLLFTLLLIHYGIGEIGGLLVTAGWGLVGISAFHLVPMVADTLSWWKLLPADHRLPLRQLLWMRWIGESVNNLLPAAQVGGDLVRARLAALKGVPLSISAAAVIVDLTAGVFTQAVFTLMGLALLIAVTGVSSVMGPILLGTFLAVALVAGFYAVQNIGIFRILRVIIMRLAQSPHWKSLVQGGESFDREVQNTYRRRGDVIASCIWTLVAWCVGVGEIWLGLLVLGQPANFAEAFILESLGQAVRGATFIVPAALGFQEGGFIIIGAMLGMPPDIALALSLVRRCRDFALGIPGLVTWQMIEGRRFWGRKVKKLKS